MNIAEILDRVSKERPDQPALIFSNPGGDPTITTYAQLNNWAAQIASGLQGLGLTEGDKMVVLAPISLNLYACLIALFRIGAAAVFLDPNSGRKRLEQAAKLADAKAFLGTRKAHLLRWISPSLYRIPNLLRPEGNASISINKLARSTLSNPSRSNLEPVDVEPEHPAMITFTSGSTDDAGARGVLRTHLLLASQRTAIANALPPHPEDIDFPSFPITTFFNLAAGVTSVIPAALQNRKTATPPKVLFDQINNHQVRTASGSPGYWLPIIQYCLNHQQTLTLRRIITGGAPVPPSLLRELSQIAPQAEILSVYGSTEAEPVAVLAVTDQLAELEMRTANGGGVPLGFPVKDIQVKILREDGTEQESPKPGEIWVSGQHVARSYLGNSSANLINKRQDEGGRWWHRMGDIGYFDSQGCLWILGRINSGIQHSGKRIYPVPVEAVIEMQPFVQRAALVGMADSFAEEKAVLVIELNPTHSPPNDWENQLLALCAKHDWPISAIYPITRLPLDLRHNSRIDYTALKRMIAKRCTFISQITSSQSE